MGSEKTPPVYAVAKRGRRSRLSHTHHKPRVYQELTDDAMRNPGTNPGYVNVFGQRPPIKPLEVRAKEEGFFMPSHE